MFPLFHTIKILIASAAAIVAAAGVTREKNLKTETKAALITSIIGLLLYRFIIPLIDSQTGYTSMFIHYLWWIAAVVTAVSGIISVILLHKIENRKSYMIIPAITLVWTFIYFLLYAFG